jgi:Matrixin
MNKIYKSGSKFNLLILILAFTLSVSFAQRANNSIPQSSKYSSGYNYYNSNRSNPSKPANLYNNTKNDYKEPRYSNEKENESYPKPKGERNNYTGNRKLFKLNKNETENYFHIDKSGKTLWDGKHWTATQFPINVYVQESSSRYYKPVFKKYVPYAFNVWRKADDRINYKIVSNKRDADIVIKFVEDLGKEYEENYLGLTEYEVNDDNEIELSTVRISLLKFGTEKISDGEIKATIVHEIGHAFGLGHSKNELDIMYPYISTKNTADMNYDELSKGDKEAIKDVIDLTNNKFFVLR